MVSELQKRESDLIRECEVMKAEMRSLKEGLSVASNTKAKVVMDEETCRKMEELKVRKIGLHSIGRGALIQGGPKVSPHLIR